MAPLEEARQTHVGARLSALHFLPASEQIKVYRGALQKKDWTSTNPTDEPFVPSQRATGEEERLIQSFHFEEATD